MNGLIITDTHVLFGEWSSVKDQYTLNDLKYIVLSKPIKEVLKSKTSIRSVLQTALDKLQFKGNQVAIAIDDDLLYHDKFTSDESLSKHEIWDYIQWETKQKWGELGNYYTTFGEIDSPNPNVLHSITCPSFLVSELKAVITGMGGKPNWAGPVSTVYLENNQYRNAIFMTDDDTFIKYFYRGRDGYSEGKLRFIAGQPSITVGIGEKDEQIGLFSSPSEIRKFVTIDLISDIKNTNLRRYRHKRLVPFEGIEVEVEDIPEDISFISLNTLSILIREFSFDDLVNFFKPAQIQDQKLTGIGKPPIDDKSQSIDKTQEQPEKKLVKTAESKIRKERPVAKQVKESTTDDKKEKKKQREAVLKDRAARKQARQARIDKKKSEKELARVDQVNKKKAEKEQAVKDKAAKKQAKIDRINKLKAEKEQAHQDRINKEKADREQVAKYKAEKEQAHQDRINKLKAEKEQAHQDRINKEKADREQAAKDKAAKKQAKIDRINKLKADKEQARKDRINKRKADIEQSKKEKADGDPKKAEKKKDSKSTGKSRLPILLIILIALLGFYFFFTATGKDLFTSFKEKIGWSESVDDSMEMQLFDQQFNQSANLLNTYTKLTSIVSPDSIISFKIIDTKGSIEFVGHDSLDIPDFEPTDYSIDPIDCCGGIKQTIDFNIKTLPVIKSDLWINISDVTSQLRSSMRIDKLRQLDMITVDGINYNPLIFEIDTLAKIDRTIQYLKLVADNVITRKIEISNSPPGRDMHGIFYIAVFEPL